MASEYKTDGSSHDESNSFTTPSVPSFIRLFVIRRILMITHKTKEKIRNLTIMLPDKQMQDKALDILLFLLSNGIKQYMSKFYNEEKQSNIIELIFNKIILTKFDKECEKITRYNSTCNDDHFQSLVFNMNDLMCLIFQFLKFDKELNGDLNNCSLVNSHWLYHSWNPNSVYHIGEVELGDLNTISVKSSRIRRARIWQRLMNVKSVHLSRLKWNDLTLKKLSMMKNIQHVIQLNVGGYSVPFLFNDRLIEIIKQIWAPKILTFNVCLRRQNINNNHNNREHMSKNTQKSPVRLVNATDITLKSKYMHKSEYILWSNKCKKLTLHRMHHVDEELVNFMIDNCDCNGIKSLTIIDVQFSPKVVSKAINPLLSKLAKKFTDLQYLRINLKTCDEHMLSLWKFLKTLVDKNTVEIELELDQFGGDFTMLNQWMTNIGYHNNINKIVVNLNSDMFDSIIPLKNTLANCMKNLQWLKIAATPNCLGRTKWNGGKKIFEMLNNKISMQENIKNDKNIKFGQWLQVIQLIAENTDDDKVFEYGDMLRDYVFIYVPIDDINKFFNLQMLYSQKFYLLIDIWTDYDDTNDTDTINDSDDGNTNTNNIEDIDVSSNHFIKKFDTLCQAILFLIKSRVAIDIKIRFDRIDDKSMFDKYDKIFLQYFNTEKSLKNYQPITNNYCVPMVHPRMSFALVDPVHDNGNGNNSQNLGESDQSDQYDQCDDTDESDDDYNNYRPYACFRVKNADQSLS